MIMHQFMLAAAVLLFATFAEPPKQIQFQCLAPDSLRETLSRDVPGIQLRELRGTDAEVALRAINEMPPKTNVVADQLMLAGMKSQPMVVVFFFRQDCLQGRAVLPQPLVERLLLLIERRGA
jgi:hypothetical protein